MIKQTSLLDELNKLKPKKIHGVIKMPKGLDDVLENWKYLDKWNRWARMSKFVYYQNYWFWKEIINKINNAPNGPPYGAKNKIK